MAVHFGGASANGLFGSHEQLKTKYRQHNKDGSLTTYVDDGSVEAAVAGGCKKGAQG